MILIGDTCSHAGKGHDTLGQKKKKSEWTQGFSDFIKSLVKVRSQTRGWQHPSHLKTRPPTSVWIRPRGFVYLGEHSLNPGQQNPFPQKQEQKLCRPHRQFQDGTRPSGRGHFQKNRQPGVWLGFPEKTTTTVLGTIGSGSHKPADQGINLHDTYSKNSIYFHGKIT